MKCSINKEKISEKEWKLLHVCKKLYSSQQFFGQTVAETTSINIHSKIANNKDSWIRFKWQRYTFIYTNVEKFGSKVESRKKGKEKIIFKKKLNGLDSRNHLECSHAVSRIVMIFQFFFLYKDSPREMLQSCKPAGV